MKIKIHVTKEILSHSRFCPAGNNTTLTNCAVSVAVRDIFESARVHYDFIHPFDYGNEGRRLDDPYKIRLPLEASEFIHTFDCTDHDARVNIKPLSFEVDIPDSVIEKIGIHQACEIISNSKTLELVRDEQL